MCKSKKSDKKMPRLLGSLLSKEVDFLTVRFNGGKVKRTETVEELAQEFKEVIKSLEANIAQIGEQALQNE